MFESIIALLLALLSIDAIRRVICALKNKRLEITASQWVIEFSKDPILFCFFTLLYFFVFLLLLTLAWFTFYNHFFK